MREQKEIDMAEKKDLANFYAPRSGQAKFDAREYMKGWEQAKIAMHCPSARVARQTLNLSIKQFAQLLDISERQVSYLDTGWRELTFAQKLLIVKALEIAREKGLIGDTRGKRK